MDSIKDAIQTSDFFIIAEIGMNHDGSLGNTLKLIEESKNCGVNAVKFQLHISPEVTLVDVPNPPYFKYEERYKYFERTAFSSFGESGNIRIILDFYGLNYDNIYKAIKNLLELIK